MALTPQIIGQRTPPTSFSYSWRDCILYALGVGAKVDELDYLYEGRGPKVLPTFAVVPSFESLANIISQLKLDTAAVRLGGQSIVLHSPIPPEATLTTEAEVIKVYDQGENALIVVEARTTDDERQPVFDNIFSLYLLGEGGCGGPPNPEETMDTPPEGTPPDGECTEQTSREQALLYRLSGDINPLHIDPAFANLAGFSRPSLHGLCTFGFAGRAILRCLCRGDAARLHTIAAHFAGTVFPGDTLTTCAWKMEPNRYIFTTTRHDGRPVLTHGVVELK